MTGSGCSPSIPAARRRTSWVSRAHQVQNRSCTFRKGEDFYSVALAMPQNLVFVMRFSTLCWALCLLGPHSLNNGKKAGAQWIHLFVAACILRFEFGSSRIQIHEVRSGLGATGCVDVVGRCPGSVRRGIGCMDGMIWCVMSPVGDRRAGSRSIQLAP